ncbi:hypothetical protein [Streptomyces sp. GSL17-111]|uniref:hypothetical protein n=1 Tax=Streptomyces sp. GSL17-111 TaxID=3121596 RepID=UPI0030F43003
MPTADDDRDRRETPEAAEGAAGEGSGEEDDAPARIGKADTPNVAGSDVQQPEIAEGPVEGLQPGEHMERGPWHPPVEVDPPTGTDVPRDAAGEPDAVRRQQEEGGP